MMNAIGNKLSRHVLGMKFMTKTKQKFDKDKTEQKFRQHYSQADVKSTDKTHLNTSATTSSSTTTTCIIEEIGSYSQCEGHIFGRQSFGGFNPTVENNVRKGIWKPFYLDPDLSIEDEVDSESKVKTQRDEEMDVSDEEMAKTYGSLVGTIGKRFGKKRDKHGVPLKNKKMKNDPDQISNNDDNNSGTMKKKKSWKNFFKGNKKQNQEAQSNNDSNEASTSKNNQKNNKKNNNKRRQSQNSVEEERAPPNKKLKFMKPSDD